MSRYGNLTDYGKQIQKCITEDYSLLDEYYDNASGFMNIPYSEYIGNKEIMESVKNLMLNTSFSYEGNRKIWYMNILMLSNDEGVEVPYVSLALGNDDLFA